MNEHQIRKKLIEYQVEVFVAALIAQAANKCSKEAIVELEPIDSNSSVIGLSITDNPDNLILFAKEINAIEEMSLIEMWTLHNVQDRQKMRYRIPVQKIDSKQTEKLMGILHLKWFTFVPTTTNL